MAKRKQRLVFTDPITLKVTDRRRQGIEKLRALRGFARELLFPGQSSNRP
jgi:hypothetical protein